MYEFILEVFFFFFFRISYVVIRLSVYQLFKNDLNVFNYNPFEMKLYQTFYLSYN